MPDEFWSWGKFWSDPKWFPTKCCAPRHVGHNQVTKDDLSKIPFEDRPEKVLLLATSWAMQTEFHKIAEELAQRHPDWTIRVKLHPRELVADYESLQSNHKNMEILSGDVDIRAAASQVRYVLSICSSSLFDVLLEDCRIAVLNSPSVEYAEDFVVRHGLPVLEANASNFENVVSALKQQSIPLNDVFHKPSRRELETMVDSLSAPNASQRFLILQDSEVERPYIAKKALKRFTKRIHENPDPEGILLQKGGPINRLGARIYRQDKQFSYNEVARSSLAELPNLNDRTRGVIELVRAGIEPARHITVIRDVIKEAQQVGNLSAIRRITNAVLSDSSESAALLRAELFEHYVVSHQDEAFGRSKFEAPFWKNALKLLRDLSPFTKRLANSYDCYASSSLRVYADTRVSKDERSELKSELTQRLRAGDNFTMMRIGDGEVYAFEPDWLPYETIEADQTSREKIWWGRTIDEEVRKSLQHQAVQCIANADYLGIPSTYRLLRDIPRTLLKMRGPTETWPATSRAHHILFEELNRMVEDGQLNWSEKVLLDDRCHQDLFLPDQLKSYVVKDRPAILVNCFAKDQINAALGTNFFDQEVRLPPHTKVKHLVPNDELAEAAMPLVLESLLDQIDQLAKNGAVFYVAGGFAGKALINRISELGSTALDIGASADYWMGATTRGPLDFSGYNELKK